jgi:hypothetical protein
MKILASRRLSKQQHGLLCLICFDEVIYYCQFTLKGSNGNAHYTRSFNTIQEASGYLDRTKKKDFDAIVAFLILQAKR